MNHSIIDYKELRALISVGTSIIQETNLETICQRVAEAVVKYSKFQRSVVSILEPDGTLRRVGFGGLTDEQITKLKQMKRSTMEEKKNIFSDKFRVGQSYYIPHDQVSLEGLKSEKEYSPNHEWHPDDFLFIPLYSIGGEIVGMVSIDDPVDGRRPTEEGLLPLEMLANQTAASIENSRNTKKLQEMLVKLREQQKVVMELSTPVIRIWERILVLPLIGTVDSSRAMQIME
ncbi:MAG: GAF domain-containing protein, partial [FCB group bacterium]|nr:GAF domain-containing protein [FCB group bacterium]